MDRADHIWLRSYPAGVAADIDPSPAGSLVDVLEQSFSRHAGRTALTCMGASLSYAQLDRDSAAVCAWLQQQGVAPGDRVALMLPNTLHFPVAFAGAIRAGAVVVNVNPLYTAHELEFQLRDSGATTIFVLENFAHTVQAVRAVVPLSRVIVCSMGEMFGSVKGLVVDFVVRRVKKLVPPWTLAGAVRFGDIVAAGRALSRQPVSRRQEDVAVLQYTGGTTGVPKGAMLLHRNLVANVLQSEAWYGPATARIPAGEPAVIVTALPLYHIFALTCCFLLAIRAGGSCLLIPNPRDFPAVVRALRGTRFHVFPAVNTLFNALAAYEPFTKLDFSHLVLSLGGGMAVQPAVAERWLEVTGCPVCEGYGLSETSPSAVCNRTDTREYSGTIGLPIPSTEIAILDDEGAPVPQGSPGEIALRGPQVMAGYWNRPDETARAMTGDGFFRTGDIGVMDERGYTRIVDRKKDMILVSGFNVYPNEVEAVVAGLTGVAECAVVGIADGHSGEAVKLFVVRRDPGLTEAAVAAYCHENLTGYKRPRSIVFRTELPKSNVGKILRRQLRDDTGA
jgi:long-chain acyl-CoA synthetase